MPDTGFPNQDARSDFSRARRTRMLSRLATRLRREPSDVDLILPLEEVVEALGRRGERSLGMQTIPLDLIVGTVDRTHGFDRSFRPTSRQGRERWERVARAQRQGEGMPPIQAYKVGEMYFVKDGHHRVSVARAQGRTEIEGYVTEVITEVDPERALRLADLPLKSHQRLFYERVPLPPEARGRISLSDPWDYAKLAEGVEAWGFRAIQACDQPMSREEVAEAWFREDYVPIVEALHEAEMIGSESETEVYLRVIGERYLLTRTHDWDDDVLERLRRAQG